MPKRRSRSRHSDEPGLFKRLLLASLLILAAALFFAGVWLLTRMGPQQVDDRDISSPEEVSGEAAALREASIALEAEFENILSIREPQAKDLELIKKALDKQRAYLEAVNGMDADAADRARNLEERYQELASAELWEESRALEKEARALAEAKQYEAARIKYLAAYERQRQINERFTLSSAYNMGRATRLQREARFLQAEPILQRSLALEAEAEKQIESQSWAEAEAKLAEAIQLQDRLNRDFRGSNQASVARLESLRIKRVGIQSGQDYVRIKEAEALADERRAANQNLEAAALYQEAARLQRALNDSFRDSPYASSERVAEFMRKAETAQSYELGLEIETNHRLLEKLLAGRRTQEATEIIVALRRDIEQMREAYPRSSLNDEALQLKIRYLNLVQNELKFIQERIDESLVPVPDAADWKILETEVAQALYALIMGTNPSRNRGDTRPVDSVSWAEAKDFCERLSWILGQPVRLPTENEFRQSLGRLRYVVLEEHVWGASNADGRAQPVGQKAPFASGCHDLLGNVSEWLESVDRFETEEARHIGGHFQDRLETIFTVPVRDAGRAERNRLIGFRVVVQTD